MRSFERITTELQVLDLEIADHDSGVHPLDAVAFGQVWNRRVELQQEIRRAEREISFQRRRAGAV